MADGERELAMGRWGMPSPAFAFKGRATDPGVTNVRNTSSPHWRRWLGPANRCIVPFTSFSEYETGPGGKKSPVWFALGEDRPLACFAGIWTSWTSVRKSKEGEITCDLYAFLTTEANAEVAPIHPKAMPVILTTQQEVDVWLNAPTPVCIFLGHGSQIGEVANAARAGSPSFSAAATPVNLSTRSEQSTGLFTTWPKSPSDRADGGTVPVARDAACVSGRRKTTKRCSRKSFSNHQNEIP
jgi:hypothetical protein